MLTTGVSSVRRAAIPRARLRRCPARQIHVSGVSRTRAVNPRGGSGTPSANARQISSAMPAATPRFAIARPRARQPIAFARDESFSSRATAPPSCPASSIRSSAPALSNSAAISAKFSMCGPTITGRPKYAGSRMLCPPRCASVPPMKTTSARSNSAASSPIESSNSTFPDPFSRLRRTKETPARASFSAAASKRSGRLGARINSSPARFSAENSAITASSSSGSPAAIGGIVLAAIQTLSGCKRSRNAAISAATPAAGGVKSYFRFPPTLTRSGGAPAATYRRPSSSVCTRIWSGQRSTC